MVEVSLSERVSKVSTVTGVEVTTFQVHVLKSKPAASLYLWVVPCTAASWRLLNVSQ